MNTTTEQETQEVESTATPLVPAGSIAQITTDAEKKLQTVSITNPSEKEAKELCSNINVNYDFAVDTAMTKFTFKKKRDEALGLDVMRTPVELAVPYPSVEGIVKIMETGGKGLELLRDSIKDTVDSIVKDILGDEYHLDNTNFPIEKLSWEAIANMPKAQRKGGGIPKEVWDNFIKDYIAVMPELTGRSVGQITNAAKILAVKLSSAKTNEPVLMLLIEQLTVYSDKAPNFPEFAECIEFLVKKADMFLNVSEEELLMNL